MARILITGSRSWPNQDAVNEALDIFVDKENDIVVHGDCETGADHFAYLWCIEHNVQQERHPAAWKRYGRSAGPRRNEEMVQKGAEICIGFPLLGASKGTWDCMNRAEQAGIQVVNMGEKYGN